MKKRDILAALLASLFLQAFSGLLPQERAKAQDAAAVKPMVYLDPRNGVMVYVETNRKLVSGISKSGQVLWTTDPLKDSGIGPYRVANPKIVYLGSGDDRAARRTDHLDLSHGYAAITYDSSQGGLLDEMTGKFIDGGRD